MIREVIIQYLLVVSTPFAAGHRCKAISPDLVGGQHNIESKVQLQYAKKVEMIILLVDLKSFYDKP